MLIHVIELDKWRDTGITNLCMINRSKRLVELTINIKFGCVYIEGMYGPIVEEIKDRKVLFLHAIFMHEKEATLMEMHTS
jgi:hypothetical protein